MIMITNILLFISLVTLTNAFCAFDSLLSDIISVEKNNEIMTEISPVIQSQSDSLKQLLDPVCSDDSNDAMMTDSDDSVHKSDLKFFRGAVDKFATAASENHDLLIKNIKWISETYTEGVKHVMLSKDRVLLKELKDALESIEQNQKAISGLIKTSRGNKGSWLEGWPRQSEWLQRRGGECPLLHVMISICSPSQSQSVYILLESFQLTC